MISLRAKTQLALANYIAEQLHSFFPDSESEADIEMLLEIIPEAMERLELILGSVKAFKAGHFDHYHSLQYATALYLLGNVAWRKNCTATICDRLFYLNKSLNSVDIHYSLELPDVFFLSHGSGAVLGKATYGNKLVIFQNVTVGRVGDDRPVLGDNVIIYPGGCVTGSSVVGNNSVISAGTIVHGVVVPDNVIVYRSGMELVFSTRRKDYSALYFRSH